MVAESDIIFLAVKPQYVSVVLKEVASALKPHHVIVSIAAGVTLQTLKVSQRDGALLLPEAVNPFFGLLLLTLFLTLLISVLQLLLQDAAGSDARVIRVMPNTPCLVGETAAAMCLGGRADDDDAEVVQTLFSAVGTIYRLDEKLLSAVTGLSGSGPAYVFVMIEALADGGELYCNWAHLSTAFPPLLWSILAARAFAC